MRDGCPFCDYEGPSEVLATFAMPMGEVFVVEPLRQVTPGHLLVIPRYHTPDYATNPTVTSDVMQVAAMLANDPRFMVEQANLVTSMGPLATQTVKHLHVHVLPRREGDGLILPWSAEDVAEQFGHAIDLLDRFVGFDDDVMDPIRAAYRKLAGERPRAEFEWHS